MKPSAEFKSYSNFDQIFEGHRREERHKKQPSQQQEPLTMKYFATAIFLCFTLLSCLTLNVHGKENTNLRRGQLKQPEASMTVRRLTEEVTETVSAAGRQLDDQQSNETSDGNGGIFGGIGDAVDPLVQNTKAFLETWHIVLIVVGSVLLLGCLCLCLCCCCL